MSRPYRVLLLDLFGTLIYLRSAPAGRPVPPVYAWLREPLQHELPALPFDVFAAALIEATQEIVAARLPDYHEVPSRERFRRALTRVGVTGTEAAGTAERLSLSHMAYLAAQTDMPAHHSDLMRDLAARYPLALVSNFDHGPTVAAILERHDVQRWFPVTLVSADFGRRKPHPAIFAEALSRLEAAPEEALFVGDTPEDDVAGARAAGLDVAWINRAGARPPVPAPTYTLQTLEEIREVLDLSKGNGPSGPSRSHS